MISSTFGAPFGGTTRGGHQVLDSLAVSLITPPNFGGSGGSCVPATVVVPLAAPTSEVCCSIPDVPTAFCVVAGVALASRASFRREVQPAARHAATTPAVIPIRRTLAIAVFGVFIAGRPQGGAVLRSRETFVLLTEASVDPPAAYQ